MIKQITTILGCALLGFGLACGNDAEGDTCRTVADIPENSERFACSEATPCETLTTGAIYGTCDSIDGCVRQDGEPTEISGKTITGYLCTGTPPAE